MKPSLDNLSRRPRNRAVSSGKRISPQPRDLLWFRKLQEHGPLPSSYLHGFSCHERTCWKRAQDRLTDLYHEERTPDQGTYLDRPFQQFDTLDARYKELVVDLREPAERALRRQGYWRERGAINSGPWRHRFMVACITASIELATRERDDINFILGHVVLERAAATLRYPTRISPDRNRKEREVDLVPDALFGLEYLSGSKKFYRFFLVEADRGTEPSRASRFNRKSHLRNFLQYREYIGQKLYKEHLGLSAGLMVLNITKDETTLNRMIALGEEVYEKGNTYMLFQSADEFAGNFAPPKPMKQFIESPWKRIGFDDFRIDKT